MLFVQNLKTGVDKYYQGGKNTFADLHYCMHMVLASILVLHNVQVISFAERGKQYSYERLGPILLELKFKALNGAMYEESIGSNLKASNSGVG